MNGYHPKSVLAPTDFSEHSSLALRYASAIASRCESRLTILHAHRFEPPLEFTSRQIDRLARDEQRDRKALHRQLREHVTEAVGTEVEAELVVVEAAPVDAVLSEAERLAADLIVMGTHGRSGVNRLLMGSVAENVVRRASCPVLTVRHKEHDFIVGGEIRLQRILLPLTPDPASMQAASIACGLSRAFGAELTVVHSVEPGQEAAPEPFSWIPEDMRSHCTFRTVVRKGDAAEQIITQAREHSSDLIVLAGRHRPFLEATVFGSTTVRVMRHAPCPVLIVPVRPHSTTAQER